MFVVNSNRGRKISRVLKVTNKGILNVYQKTISIFSKMQRDAFPKLDSNEQEESVVVSCIRTIAVAIVCLTLSWIFFKIWMNRK